MTLWTAYALSIALSIAFVTALTAVLSKPVHAWLYRNRWTVRKWEDL